jgi:S1-C subfamily serine protease
MSVNGFNPEYRKADPPVTMGRSNFKVTLGLIPDFTYEKGDGFRIGSVTDGKPAQKAGMQAGDIITSMNGKKVSNIYDYMTRLGELKTGDFVDVEAIREGKEIKIKIKL